MMTDCGFVEVTHGARIDTFGGAPGEEKARQFDVWGYSFFGRKPG